MILYNHQKYKEFWNILVGGYIHRTIPDKFQPEWAYINDLLEINSAFVFNQEDMSTYSFENFQEYEVQMTLTEIDDTILTIKENLELFSNKDIILKLNNNYNDKVWFSIFQDLKEEINNSDKECYFLFQELIDVNFPSSMLKWIESKLRIDSDSCLILIIEYFKFLILKSKHPSEWISSFFIDKVWIEHWVLTKHFHDIWDKVLNIDEEVLHYTPPPTDAIAFKDKYEQTIILYRKIFGWEPHPQIWRDLNIEYNDFQKSLYNVNLERLVNYYRFEDEILSPILADLDIPNKAKFFDKIVNDYAKLNWNINNFSGTKMRLMLFNREIRQKAGKHIASSHLWRKYCVIDDNVITSASLKSDKNLYWVGGFKFSWKKGYQLDYYWYINDDDNLLINLDDLADDSWESVHLYIDKGSHNLNLNNDLIEGQEEADLHFCTKYQR